MRGTISASIPCFRNMPRCFAYVTSDCGLGRQERDLDLRQLGWASGRRRCRHGRNGEQREQGQPADGTQQGPPPHWRMVTRNEAEPKVCMTPTLIRRR